MYNYVWYIAHLVVQSTRFFSRLWIEIPIGSHVSYRLSSYIVL